MGPVYINDKAVVDLVPYAARHVALRLDVGPFALLYLAVYLYIFRYDIKDGWGNAVVLVALPALLVCHLLVFLSTQWSVRFMCLVSQRRVASIDRAECVLVVPAKHCGSAGLVPLQRRSSGMGKPGADVAKRESGLGSTLEIAGRVFTVPELWFVFHQTKFVLSNGGSKEAFVRLEFPSEGSFKAYLGCRGLRDEAAVAVATERWGPNVLDIPMPAFMTLFAEHAVAPFFVFQILCVTLWSLDDYWYYALFTLVMLVLFEAMLCVQRQKNLEMLRSMRREPTVVYTLRAGRWRRVSSEAVTPGEVVSLVARPQTVASAMREAQRRAGGGGGGGRGRGKFGFPGGIRYGGGGLAGGGQMGMDIVSGDGGGGGEGGDEEALSPFDLLLMRGSCVVNEAMLTGESVPQAKTSLLSAGGSGDAWMRVEDGTDSPLRKHIIFSGTKVLQHADGDSGVGDGGGGDGTSRQGGGAQGGEGVASLAGLPPPPDKGCPCVVLRTGFETSQGQLMKTILFATKRVAAGSDWETGVFIFILLVFAAVASAFVLAEGLADETRNPFKLVLHCIMILTSVIPPELPIELSLAVMNSLTALTQSLIFCTEPFRIPLAGKVDICCFDKTGTLTSDNLVMKGVAGAPGGDAPGGGGAGGGGGGGGGKEASPKPATVAVPVAELGEVPTRILAGCHSLVTLNGALIGDSVEVATLKGLGWTCLRGGLVVPKASARATRALSRERDRQSAAAGNGSGAASGGGGDGSGPDAALRPLQVAHSWSFDPSLRRMCTAVHLAAGTTAIAAPSPTSAGDRGDVAGGGGVPAFHDRIWIVAKGAPESLEALLLDAPPNYRSTFLHHMGQGSRVLALAYRALEPAVNVAACRRMSRASAEEGLRFGGFLVLGCPIKPDAPYVVRELRESSHAVAMITGDGALTAADVARQVGMIDHPPSRTLVLSLVDRGASTGGREAAERGGGGGGRAENNGDGCTGVKKAEAEGLLATAADGTPAASLCWVSLAGGLTEAASVGVRQSSNGDQRVDSGSGSGGGGTTDDGGGVIPFDAGGLAALAERHALCVTGDVLPHVGAMTLAFPDASANPKVTATAVVGQDQNASVATAAAASVAHSPLSALCSHVTVFARVSPAQKELIVGELNATGRTTVMCGDGTNDVGALRRAHVGISIVNSPELEKRLEAFIGGEQRRAERDGLAAAGDGDAEGGSGRRRKSYRVSEAKQSRMLASREIEEQDLDPALVKLGDASIASPFTAKTTSVGCVLAVVRQGRCTLVTTLQVYKVLALNCLTSAYMLSALYLKGVKQGDGQMTVLGLVVSAFFYCASRSTPLRRLSAERPPARIFCAQACLSVLGQFSAHLLALLAITRLCEGHVNPEDPSVMPDGPFRPNTFNSAVFLLSSVMQVNTFAANYTGHPFMQSLRENRPMWYIVLGAYASLAVAASGLAPSLEAWLQLAPFPEGLRAPLVMVLAADTALVFLVENGTGWWARRRSIGGVSRRGSGRRAGRSTVAVGGGRKRKERKRSKRGVD